MLLFAMIAGTLPARAVEPPDFVPSRAIALGDNILTASGTDAIFLNPAGLGATNGYAVQLDYTHSTGAGGGDAVVISLADSLSNPSFPTGLAYRYLSVGSQGKDAKGSVKDFALAYPVSNNVVIGTHVAYLSYTEGGRDFNQFTGDLGTLLRFGPVCAAVVGTNLLLVDSPDLPRGLGTGLSYGDGQSYLLAGDFKWEWPGETMVHSWSLAGEYLLGGLMPVRLAYSNDGRRQTSFISGGLGFVTHVIGANVSYRRDLTTNEGLWSFGLVVYNN